MANLHSLDPERRKQAQYVINRLDSYDDPLRAGRRDESAILDDMGKALKEASLLDYVSNLGQTDNLDLMIGANDNYKELSLSRTKSKKDQVTNATRDALIEEYKTTAAQSGSEDNNLTHGYMPYMKFLFVRPDVCRQLLSDSNSRWTPLLLAVCFPLLGLIGDLHPLANTHAEHTKKAGTISIMIPTAYKITDNYSTYSSILSAFLFICFFTRSTASETISLFSNRCV